MAPRKPHGTLNLTVNYQDNLVMLRHYELEAYAAVITALRAEGHMNDKKKSVLKDLRDIFGISIERHKAEIRRAANDAFLSEVAKQIQGMECDEDWLCEGRRIVGVLKHPLPITAYTKIADEVAQSLLLENEEVSEPNQSNELENTQEKAVHPSQNPQHVLNNEMFDDIIKLNENQQVSPSEEENVDSMDQDLLDSYVFLPGGTVVKVEPSKTAKKLSDHSSVSPTKVKYCTKKQTTPISKSRTDFIPESKSIRDREESLIELPKHENVNKDSLKRPFLENQQLHQSLDFLQAKIPKQQEFLDRSSRSFQLDHIYSTGNNPRGKYLSRSLNSTWATKDNATTESRSRKRLQRSSLSNSRKTGRSLHSTAKRTSPSDKRARISGAQTFTSHNQNNLPPQPKTSPKHVSIYPKLTSVLHSGYSHSSFNPSLDEAMVRSDSNMQQSILSPQKVFCPTMQISSPPLEKTSMLASRELFASSTSHLMQCPVEAGLAPVSAIVSQVASQADTPPSVNLSPTVSQHLEFHPGKALTSNDSDSMFHSAANRNIASQISPKTVEAPADTSVQTASVGEQLDSPQFPVLSSPLEAAIKKRSPEFIEDLQLIPPSSSSSLHAPTAHVSSAAKTVKLADNDVVSCSISTAVTTTQLEPTATITAIKPLSTSLSRVSSTMTSVPVTTSIMPALSHLSTANIIRMTPRPAIGPKGPQITTPFAGGRITKAFGSTGQVKPSIIVVRQAGKKTVLSTSTKLLEIESSSKAMPRKAVVSGTKAAVKPATIIRPVAAKVSLREGSAVVATGTPELTTSAPALHKVVTKGKMRQLVLKPASSPVIRHSNPDVSSSLLPTVESRGQSDLALNEDNSENFISSPLHAASTIKALVSFQKTPSNISGLSGAPHAQSGHPPPPSQP